MRWSAHFFPAQDSPNLMLCFSPGVPPLEGAQDDSVSDSPGLWELAGSLCLFHVQSHEPPTSGSGTTSGRFDNCLVLSTMPPGCLSLAEATDSVVELPFLGLIKFHTHPYVLLSERVSWIKFKLGRPVRARMSRQLAKQDYPDIQNPHLSQLGLHWVTMAQSKPWIDLERKWRVGFELALQRLQEWQQQSLRDWQDHILESESRKVERLNSWPERMWELWLLSGLRGWQSRIFPRQNPSENGMRGWRQLQELQYREWRELREMRERKWKDALGRKPYYAIVNERVHLEMQANRERIWRRRQQLRENDPWLLLGRAPMGELWGSSGSWVFEREREWIEIFAELDVYLQYLSQGGPVPDSMPEIKWQQQFWLDGPAKQSEYSLWELSEVSKRGMQEEERREGEQWEREELEREELEREELEREELERKELEREQREKRQQGTLKGRLVNGLRRLLDR
ncbi:hypothetical protein B0H67DRAFT_322040 [Lasiosphaeris hirsuta]|uniref:Uncharacterized protein n=1 Tax=Lasiosphaeris hirsuta TaxID=260670 RepID=A0AA40DLP2_9PEZI|nr:hypothetical protein B0H67DRAFT_322040 [Lasiosphaeris hirsuta]